MVFRKCVFENVFVKNAKYGYQIEKYYKYTVSNFIKYKFTLFVFVYVFANTNMYLTPAMSSVEYDLKLIHLATVDSRYLAPVGSQNSRARVKWFSRYLALSREGPNSRLPESESHTVTSAPLKPKQYVER